MNGQLPRNRLILGVAALAYGIPMLISGAINQVQTILYYLQYGAQLNTHSVLFQDGIMSGISLAGLGLLVIGGIMLLRGAGTVALWLYAVVGLVVPLVHIAYTSSHWSILSGLSLNGTLMLHFAYLASSLLFPFFVVICLLHLRRAQPAGSVPPFPMPPAQ